MLPEAVLREAQRDLLNWKGRGLSVMEISHRSHHFQELMDEAEASLRSLLAIPDHYHVLFLGGAARTHFAMIPMNCLGPDERAAYLVSGIWSSMAFDEASKLKHAYRVGNSSSMHATALPDYHPDELHADTAYLYYTPNETINGLRFPYLPEAGFVPLIADMTSCLLSEPIRVSDYGLIFAGAQKNIAPAGLTIAIIRGDLLDRFPDPVIPTMLDYRVQVDNRSLYATPPMLNCYMANLMFDWIKTQGGVDGLYQQNCLKAAKLYNFIDDSPFYQCAIAPNARSLVNVCFTLSDPQYEEDFIAQSEAQGLYGLRGHRTIGGLRASIYNAMPMAGVDALIAFMDAFAK